MVQPNETQAKPVDTQATMQVQPTVQAQAYPAQPQPVIQAQAYPAQPQPVMQARAYPAQPQPVMQAQVYPAQPQPVMQAQAYPAQPQPVMQAQAYPAQQPAYPQQAGGVVVINNNNGGGAAEAPVNAACPIITFVLGWMFFPVWWGACCMLAQSSRYTPMGRIFNIISTVLGILWAIWVPVVIVYFSVWAVAAVYGHARYYYWNNYYWNNYYYY